MTRDKFRPGRGI